MRPKCPNSAPHTNCHHSGGEVMFCSFRTCASCSHVSHELPQYQSSLVSNVRPKEGPATEQRSQTQQQISNRMLKKKRLMVLQWSGQTPDLNLTEMLLQDLRRAVHKQIPANVNELK